MDDHHFDTLTRTLGAGVSRRTALRSALGGLLAAVAGATALSAVEAKNGKGHGTRQDKRKKAQGPHKQVRAQQGTSCPAGTAAVCQQTGGVVTLACATSAPPGSGIVCSCSGAIAGVPACATLTQPGRPTCPPSLLVGATCPAAGTQQTTCQGRPCSITNNNTDCVRGTADVANCVCSTAVGAVTGTCQGQGGQTTCQGRPCSTTVPCVQGTSDTSTCVCSATVAGATGTCQLSGQSTCAGRPCSTTVPCIAPCGCSATAAGATGTCQLSGSGSGSSIITTVTVPVSPAPPTTVITTPSTGGAGKRKRRRRKGGRRRH